MSILYVFYNKDLVGVLTKNSDATLSFKYENAWTNSSAAFALSPILSLNSDQIFTHRQTSSFFENLIPEGKAKEQLEKLTGKSLTSGYKFLEEYGGDCAGAFVISPDKNMPDHIVEDEFDKLDMKQLSKAYNNNQNLMTHVMKNHNGKFSLAGVQDKVPVVYYQGDVYTPTKGAATSHILKPPHQNKTVKDSVYNEYFCMKLAAASGLDVPKVEIIESDVPFYLIERYDRKIDSGKISRIHQIDFCQAQSFLASEKYESDSGPTLKNNYDCILEHSSRGIKDSKKLIDWICFNILVGNNDCHSKNISFLVNNGSLQLAPFYDLLCTSIYKEYTANFPYKIGGNNSWGQWDKSNFQQEMEIWGLHKSKDLFLASLSKMVGTIQIALATEVIKFKDKYPKVKSAQRIASEIETRIKSFEKRLF